MFQAANHVYGINYFLLKMQYFYIWIYHKQLILSSKCVSPHGVRSPAQLYKYFTIFYIPMVSPITFLLVDKLPETIKLLVNNAAH